MDEDWVSISGNSYVTIFVILKSTFIMIFLHNKRSKFPELLEKAFLQAGYTPKILLTDGLKEDNSEEVMAICQKQGILKQMTNAHQQFQNGAPEKLVDTINKGVRTALLTCNLPKAFWVYAAINVVDVYNHLPHSTLNRMTQWEAEKGTLPNVSMFKQFGC